MGNAYKLTGDRLKGDPYTGVCISSMETAEPLCLIQDYCQTNAFNLASPQQTKHWT